MKTIKNNLVILFSIMAFATACVKEPIPKPVFNPSITTQETGNNAIVTPWMQTGHWTDQSSGGINSQKAILTVPGLSQNHLLEGQTIVFARFNEYRDPVTRLYGEVKLPFEMAFRSDGSFQNEYWRAAFMDGKIAIEVKNPTNKFVSTGGMRSQNSFRAFVLMPATIQNLALKGVTADKIPTLSYQRMCALLEVEP